MGFRSPSMNALAGQSSPGQGRSLREYEEQMSALRKENFNLKLRIYFLEENAGIGGGGGSGGNTSGGANTGTGAGITGHGSPTDGTIAPESLFKQNIDLKVGPGATNLSKVGRKMLCVTEDVGLLVRAIHFSYSVECPNKWVGQMYEPFLNNAVIIEPLTNKEKV